MSTNPFKRLIAVCIFALLLLPTVVGGEPPTTIPHTESMESTQHPLDIAYLYNITEALSSIIFDVYDEEAGEIAKGRVFGSKGEQRAAELLAENMSALGLYTTLEQLAPRPSIPNDDIIHKLEVLDYQAQLNDGEIECYIAPAWKGPRENPNDLDCTFSYHDLHIKPLPQFPFIYKRSIAQDDHDFVFNPGQ